MEVVPSGWKRYVSPKDQPVDRRYYTLCMLERLHEALRRHDVFVEESTHWGDPRANDPDAQMTRKGMRGQTLPVGGCGRLIVLGECSHANKCLTCSMWLTSTEDLPALKSFYECAIRLKQRARAPSID